MAYKYATQTTEKMAKAVILSQAVSTKQSIEVASFIRGRSTKQALELLSQVAQTQRAVPYKRFTNGAGHKPGIGPGKFPLKTIGVFEKAVKLAIANATDKSMDVDSLKIASVVVNRGPNTPRYGRIRGRTAKVTHIEIVVEEVEATQKKRPKKQQKEVTQTKVKVESKSQEPSSKSKEIQKTQSKSETVVKADEKPAEVKAESTSQKPEVEEKKQ